MATLTPIQGPGLKADRAPPRRKSLGKVWGELGLIFEVLLHWLELSRRHQRAQQPFPTSPTILIISTRSPPDTVKRNRT